MSDVPTLSIVVPCFNEEFNLPELVDRVLVMLERGKLTGELAGGGPLVDLRAEHGDVSLLPESPAEGSREEGGVR